MQRRRAVTSMMAAVIGIVVLVASGDSALAKPPAADLQQGFQQPPEWARPWVYWFWLNGNITREGITADLEAMKRAGIGGVLIMEVDQGVPEGKVPFASPQWRKLFQHVCSEADRLGLEVNMNNDAGWCGSGGPWVPPELAMQRLVWTETPVEGPRRFEGSLPRAKAVAGYYRDVAVLAFPAPTRPAKIIGIRRKSFHSAMYQSLAARATWPADPVGSTVPRNRVLDLTKKMDANGRLVWDVPEGRWTILRIGHTPTGKDNHPAPESGRGLECDKLSRRAVQTHFAGFIGKLIQDVGPLAGKTLVATHIDSWEVGVQNWTPKFRDEFHRRRGYDPLPWLPVVTGRVIGSREQSERFLWDLRQTVGELLLENYAGYMRQLAQKHGLRLSIEAYTSCPVNELEYAGRADEPMGEFWSWRKYGAAFSCTEMASAAHVYGKPIVGAEAFTATNEEAWQGHPGNIKDLGDWAFCEGINRFVFHRYALQPWRDRRPGMSMGPWGLHYERTQTWWELSKAWHEYLARCQFLLQQGRFVADICLLTPEGAPQSLRGQRAFTGQRPDLPLERPGHNFDLCPPELVLKMTVRNGRLVLPSGMSYRLLALPQVETMTPELLAKVKELVEAGATVVGAPPQKSPSLTDYPQCDTEVERLAGELWPGRKPPSEVAVVSRGKGRIVWGGELTQWYAAERPSIPRLANAKWIWHDGEGDPARAVPPGVRYFRREFQLDAKRRVRSAQLVITADNSFVCWINGRQVLTGNTFRHTFLANVARYLKPGQNVVAVEARNAANAPNPAGLIAVLQVRLDDGSTFVLPTDGSWRSCKEPPEGWISPAKGPADSRWAPVRVLGPPGIAPWGDVEESDSSSDLYPDVLALGRVLDRLGVPPDFQFLAASGERSLRYIHRRIGETDVYFVANKRPEAEAAVCLFRVSGRRPELWWPRTGRIERPAVYDEIDGRLCLP
ncbi:MAG: hypothetical protein GXP27_04805, partial [Planctomycetes bacterium]|nr:hypothetical protein [Planctomycetota bacterium]